MLFLLQAGWQAELVMPITLESINGLRSRDAAGLNQYAGDEDFYEAIEILGRVQRSNAIGMQIVTEGDQETALIVIRRDDMGETIKRAVEKLDRLLGLDPDTSEIKVVYRAVQKDGTEIATLRRSMLHIMDDLGFFAGNRRTRGAAAGHDPLVVASSSRRPSELMEWSK